MRYSFIRFTVLFFCCTLYIAFIGCISSEKSTVYISDRSSKFTGDISKYREYVNGTKVEKNITVDEMAHRWAPVHYQDIRPVGNDRSRSDYITRVDRDLPGKEGGVWDLSLNTKKLDYRLRAYVYYSVVSTKSHHFITFSFYHSWDTYVIKMPLVGRKRIDWDKTDLEGVMFVIKRDGSWGILEAVFTQSHGYIYTYLPYSFNDRSHPDYNKFREVRHWRRSIRIRYSNEAMTSMKDKVMRVITSQEEGGHGAGCFPDWGAPSCKMPKYKVRENRHQPNPGGGDHIRYIPSRETAGEPDFDDIYDDGPRYTYCKYRLINVFDPDGGLWFHRFEDKVFTGINHSFIGVHGYPLWLWQGTSDSDYCDELNLNDIEYDTVNAVAHPWTHNPADLARVYLRVNNESSNNYFSGEYTWNLYNEDDLGSSVERIKEKRKGSCLW